MRAALFTEDHFQQMAEDVCALLSEVGYLVDHPGIREKALRGGCRESPQGRTLFGREHVSALRERLLQQYPPLPPGAPEPSLIHARREIRVGFGNLTPTFYDYAKGVIEGGTTSTFLDLMKFVHAEPRIAGVTLPLSRQDTPPEIEQIESVVLMARMTDKGIGAVDAMVPEAVPFLGEMGEALGCDPAEFVGCCNCINPPLRLEKRTAETMLQRSRYHSRSMITSMPAIGGSGPVDLYGSIVLATAEIVGGLILSMILDPQAPLLGYIACIQLDMLTGNPSSSTPQTVRVDAGVLQLMEHSFGGGTRIGGRSYVSARRPGLQALFERFEKALGYSMLADGHVFGFAGNGNLNNGSTISPEQFLLDMEFVECLEALWTAPETPSPREAVGRIREAVLRHGGNFLTTEHTLSHYRDEMWTPSYFQCLINTRTEKEILDKCHQDYRHRVEHYEPPAHPVETLNELERILRGATDALL